MRKKILLLCSGELRKELVIALQRLGQYIIAVDNYENAPAMQVAHDFEVIDMLDGDALDSLVEKHQPDLIVPEVESIRTERFYDYEKQGFKVIPSAKAANFTMNRKAIRDLAAKELGVKTAKYRYATSYEELKKVNPAIVYASISAYGQDGPHADFPGTDAIGQALGGVAEAYAGPGESMRTGLVSVADETCAILTFGGLLAALYHAKKTGVGQKVETSLVGGIVRLMGWTMTTTMWRNSNPIAGARINGTREYPGIAASFDDQDGKPMVFQLDHRHWEKAMRALGFWDTLEERGASDLGLALVSEEKKSLILETLGNLFGAGKREIWINTLREADIVAAPINTL